MKQTMFIGKEDKERYANTGIQRRKMCKHWNTVLVRKAQFICEQRA